MHAEAFVKMFDELDFLFLAVHRQQAENAMALLIGILLCPQNSISGIAAFFEGNVCQSTLNRFLRLKDISTAKLLKLYRRWITQKLESSKIVYGIIDDTILHKSGVRLPGVHYDYDHTKGNTCLAQTVVIALLRGLNRDYLFGMELYEKNAKKFRSKIDWAVILVRQMTEYSKDKTFIALFDSWYCCQKLIDSLPAGVKWISRLKRNRIIRVGGQKKSLRDFMRSVNSWNFRRVSVDGKIYWCYDAIVEVNRLGTMKIVLTKHSKYARKVSAALVSNMLDDGAETIIRHFMQRWNIEVCIRTEKQSLGFEGCMVRSKKAIRRYWLLLMTAFSFLSVLKTKAIGCKTHGDVINWIKKRFAEFRGEYFKVIQIHVEWIFAKA